MVSLGVSATSFLLLTIVLNRVETQDSLLSGQKSISRMVELGPSKTLVGLGRKTINRKVASCGRPLDQTVQLLASTQDTKTLYYEYEPSVESQGEVLEEKTHSKVEVKVSLPEPTRNVLSNLAASMVTSIIEDVPISGEEIVRTLIARKLKKPIPEITLSKSIKELCGGVYLLFIN